MKPVREAPGFLPPGWETSRENLIIRNILESMSDCLIVLGADGEVLYANRISKDILGYEPDELKTHGIGELFFVNEENYDFNQVFVDAVWKKSVNDYHEVDYHHPDGTTKRLAATTSYLLADGEHESSFIGFVAMFKDITEVFNLRKKEQDLTREKERIAGERISSLNKLAMGVAHEIRNPVVTIGGFAARIARDRNNPEETIRSARKILEDALKLEAVVREVQQYCDLPEPDLTKVRFRRVVEQAIDEIETGALKRGITFQLHDYLPEDHRAVCDPTLMKTALVLLFENAVDFSPEGSLVEVGTYKTAEGTVVEVRDSGSGISNQDREFIFQPFFSSRAQGSGMGLATVERIVHDHMGRVEVESEAGAGTTVRLMLPERSLENSGG